MTETTTAPSCKRCGTPLQRASRGPAPTYCSAGCRARAKDERAKQDGRYAQQLADARVQTKQRQQANAKPCPYCSAPMTHPKRIQCGAPDCQRRYNAERMRALQLKHKAETGQWLTDKYGRKKKRTCVQCGKHWESGNAKANYCSVSCANSARVYQAVCDECGKAWEPKASRARWCSRECAHASRFSKELVLRTPTPWWVGRAWPAMLPRLRQCWHAGRCRRCETPFVTDQPRIRYCSTQCSRSDAKARRRARKRNAYVADVYRARIFERDKWTCQLCNRRVARTRVVPHPKAPVLDHIIPLANGGTHEPANVQCAHFICNSIKSNYGGGEQLMLIG